MNFKFFDIIIYWLIEYINIYDWWIETYRALLYIGLFYDLFQH